MKSSIIVTGPAGCGKTLNSGRIAANLGLSKVLDGWGGENPEQLSQHDTLILTNVSATVLNEITDLPIMHYASVMKHIH